MSKSIWREKRFVMYATGATINNLGNAMFNLALPLLVYHMTQSAVNMGLMAICMSLPQAVLALLIGSIVDRYSRRVVMISALCVQAVASSFIPLLNSLGVMENWMLYVVGVVIAIGQAFLRTAEFAVVPAMFPDRKLEAMAGMSSCFTATTILGPVLAGFLIGYLNYNSLFWINTISYLGPVLLCIWSRIPHERLGGVSSVQQVFRNMREGLAYIGANKAISALYWVIGLAVLADSGLLSLVLYHLKDGYQLADKTISWIVLAEGIGMFVAALFIPKFAKYPKGKTLFYSLLLCNISVALLLIPVVWIVPVALLMYAMVGMLFTTTNQVTLQELVPNDMLGRVGGISRMINQIGLSVSTAMLTGIAGLTDVSWAYAVAVFLGSIPLLIIMKGSLRTLGKQGMNTTETTAS